MSENIDYRNEVELLLRTGEVNRFMASSLLEQSKSGLDRELWSEGVEDAKLATKLGVSNKDEFKTFFYIEHFVDDVAKDTIGIILTPEERGELVRYMFSLRHEISFTNLLSFKAAILKWVKSKHPVDKLSHPNVGGNYKPLKKYNIDKWYSLATEIRDSVKSGLDYSDSLRRAAGKLESPERYDFLTWYNYYAKKEDKKYNINDQIRTMNRNTGDSMLIQASFMDDGSNYYIPKMTRDVFSIEDTPSVKDDRQPASDFFESNKKNEQRAFDFEAGRNKLMNRTFAIDKLLEKYRKVLSEEEIEGIEETLNQLRKKVRKLKFANSITDCLVKTANILKKRNFTDGALALFAIAEDPLADPIPSVSEAPAKPRDANKEARMKDIVAQLEVLSAVLKNREVIRSLAKVDLQLHDMNMAVFFPEITEAQGKLIEAFGYASNKIEDILPKIKGSVMSESVKSEDTKGISPESSTKGQVASEVRELAEPLKLKHTREVVEAPEVSSPVIKATGPFKA